MNNRLSKYYSYTCVYIYSICMYIVHTCILSLYMYAHEINKICLAFELSSVIFIYFLTQEKDSCVLPQVQDLVGMILKSSVKIKRRGDKVILVLTSFISCLFFQELGR